jgi:hypothetical protein
MTARVAGHQLIPPDVKLGRDVQIYGFVNLYGCEVGDETSPQAFPLAPQWPVPLHECSARRA